MNDMHNLPDYLNPAKNIKPRENPPSYSPAAEAAKRFYEEEERKNSVIPVAEPKTEKEAAELLQIVAWRALARLATIINNPNASDTLVVQAAKEIANQLQKRNAEQAAGVTYTMMPMVRVDNVPLVLHVGKP